MADETPNIIEDKDPKEVFALTSTYRSTHGGMYRVSP